jgi:hypothetical protein
VDLKYKNANMSNFKSEKDKCRHREDSCMKMEAVMKVIQNLKSGMLSMAVENENRKIEIFYKNVFLEPQDRAWFW